MFLISFVSKILTVIPLLASSGIALVQVVIKAVKEILTAVINLFFPFFPDGGKFEVFVLKMRDKVNKFDAWFETVKEVILRLVGAVGKNG